MKIFKKLRLLHRIKKLEQINEILMDSKPKMIQLYNHHTINLDKLQNHITTTHIYGTQPLTSVELFKTEIETLNHNILDIKVSASFMLMISKMIEGSVIIKLIVNGTLLAENETSLIKNGYSNITLNHLQEVEEYSSYTVIVMYECCVSTNNYIEIPQLSIANNCASLSITTM